MSKTQRRRLPRQLHIIDDTDLRRDGIHSSTAKSNTDGIHSSTATPSNDGIHSSTARRQALLKRIETLRKQDEISIARLCAEARIHPNTYRELRLGNCVPLDITLVKLTKALERIRAGHEAEVERKIIQSFVRLLTSDFATRGGLDPVVVLSQTFESEKTNDPTWLGASRCRRQAIYVLVEVLGVGKAKVAQAIGITRQAAHKTVAAVECERMRDAAFDAFMQAAVDDAMRWK
jgi:hypothetical protein